MNDSKSPHFFSSNYLRAKLEREKSADLAEEQEVKQQEIILKEKVKVAILAAHVALEATKAFSIDGYEDTPVNSVVMLEEKKLKDEKPEELNDENPELNYLAIESENKNSDIDLNIESDRNEAIRRLKNRIDTLQNEDMKVACQKLIKELTSLPQTNNPEEKKFCNEIINRTYKLLTPTISEINMYDDYDKLIKEVHNKGSQWSRVKQVMGVVLGLALITTAVLACVGTFGAMGPFAVLAIAWGIMGIALCAYSVVEKDPYRKTANTMSKVSFFGKQDEDSFQDPRYNIMPTVAPLNAYNNTLLNL